PRAAIFFGRERPTHGVDNFARGDTSRGNFPKLLYPHAIGLGIGIFGKIEFRNELLGEGSARAFREDRNLSFQVVAWFEVRFRLVLVVHAFVIGADTSNAVSVEEKFRSRKTGEDSNPGLLDLAAQPLHKLVQRDDVVAMIAQRGRSNGQLELA